MTWDGNISSAVSGHPLCCYMSDDIHNGCLSAVTFCGRHCPSCQCRTPTHCSTALLWVWPAKSTEKGELWHPPILNPLIVTKCHTRYIRGWLSLNTISTQFIRFRGGGLYKFVLWWHTDARVLACMAGVKAGCAHLCRVAGNTVWSRTASDTL